MTKIADALDRNCGQALTGFKVDPNAAHDYMTNEAPGSTSSRRSFAQRYWSHWVWSNPSLFLFLNQVWLTATPAGVESWLNYPRFLTSDNERVRTDRRSASNLTWLHIFYQLFVIMASLIYQTKLILRYSKVQGWNSSFSKGWHKSYRIPGSCKLHLPPRPSGRPDKEPQ